MAKRKGRSRKGSYKLTTRRRVALKKAQTVSARKRRAAPNKRRSPYSMSPKTKRNLAIGATGVAVTALTAGGIVARHKLSGSSFTKTQNPVLETIRGQKTVTGSRTASFISHKMTGKGHPPGGTRVFKYRTAKQGPLGTSFDYTYTHKPLLIPRSVSGSKTQSKVSEAGVPGGMKTYGGTPILAAVEFQAPKPVAIISKEVPSLVKGTFKPTQPRSKATVGGVPLEEYLRGVRKRHA